MQLPSGTQMSDINSNIMALYKCIVTTAVSNDIGLMCIKKVKWEIKKTLLQYYSTMCVFVNGHFLKM